jgi:hypothetical protein
MRILYRTFCNQPQLLLAVCDFTRQMFTFSRLSLLSERSGLSTGHNKMRYHLHTKLKIGTTSLCRCGLAEHVLQECNALNSQTYKTS